MQLPLNLGFIKDRSPRSLFYTGTFRILPMSRLTKTPPLINLHPTPLGPVQVHFNEPFLQQQGSRKTRAVLQLLALLSCLELVLAKKSSLEEVRMIDDLSKAMLKKLTKEENALKAQLETVWIQLDSKDLLYRRTMMHDMKLRELFPRAANETGGTFVQSSDATDISAHYRRVAQYDQLYASAARLYHSLSLDDHKYIPYRLAIVYQCLAPLDKPFADHRARIQECFELINSHIIDQEQKNKDEPPRLTKEQTTILEKLLKELMEQIVYAAETNQPVRINQYKLLYETVLTAHKHACTALD